MKKAVALLSIGLLMAACQSSPVPKETTPEPQEEALTVTLSEAEIIELITQDFESSHEGEPAPNIELLEKNDAVSFYQANPDGLGGYILYSGAMSLYRYTEGDAQVKKIEGFLGDFVTDISSDNQFAVGFATFEGSTKTEIGARVTNLETGAYKDYLLESETTQQAGAGFFSPDNNKLAFAVTTTDIAPEYTQVYSVDLLSGKISEVEAANGIPTLQWNGNELEVSWPSGLLY